MDENGKKLDEDVVTVAETGGKTSTFEHMLAALPLDQCRYIAYDCQYTTVNEQKRSKVGMVVVFAKTFNSHFNRQSSLDVFDADFQRYNCPKV